MRSRTRFLCLAPLLVVLVPLAMSSAQDAVVLDRVTGLAYDGALMAGRPIAFYFKYNVETGTVRSTTASHRLYSPDGAEWSVPVIESVNPGLSSYWDAIVGTYAGNSDGSGADTLGFSAFVIFAQGLPVGYDSLLYRISFTVDEAYIGKTICLDSSFFPPGGEWAWLSNVNGSFTQIAPAWGGPHCFEIVPCCFYRSGDVNLDGKYHNSDVNYLAAYLFRGWPPPPCIESADVDGSGGDNPITIADITYMISFLFKFGPEPVLCPGVAPIAPATETTPASSAR